MNWTSVRDELPPPQKKVLVFYKNQLDEGRIITAQYIPPLTVRAFDFYDYTVEFDCDFVDGDDEGFVKESWHEVVDNWDDFAGCQVVNGKVSHWMPLPDFPAISQRRKK